MLRRDLVVLALFVGSFITLASCSDEAPAESPDDGGTSPDAATLMDGATNPDADALVAPPPAAKGTVRWRSAHPDGWIGAVAFSGEDDLVFVTTLAKATDFDGRLIPLQDAGPGVNETDLAVVKLDANGKAKWATRVGGAGYEEGRGIAVDAQGDVYVTGSSMSDAVNAGSFTAARPSNATMFGFVVKLNGASGAPIWAQTLGGADGVTRCAAIAANGSDLAVGCNFEAPVMPYTTVDGMPATLQLRGVVSGFVARLDAASGKARWATAIYTSAEARGVAVLPGGDVFVGGVFSVALSDSVGSSMLPIAVRGSSDAFLMRLAAVDGKAKWATTLAAPKNGFTSVSIWGVGADLIGGLAAAGAFFGVADLGAGSFDSASGGDGFAISIDPTNGKTRWAKAFGGNSSVRGNATSIDRWGQVVVGASYDEDLQLDGNALPPTAPGTDSNAVVIKLAADGGVLWTKAITATPVSDAGSTLALVGSVATSPAGDVAYGGRARGRIDFVGDGKVDDPGAFIVRTSP